VIPITPIIIAPIEFTFMINIIPTKIAIAAITNAKIFITASGNNRCGKKVIASEIGPPNTVSEIRKTASRASDSKGVT
jgi:hypothetical protein